MVSVLKSENSEKSTYKNSPNNSLDQKPKGRKERMKDCASFPLKLGFPNMSF